MEGNVYQARAYRAIQDHKTHQEEVMHWTIGIGEEAGEVAGVIKHKYYGGEYDIEDIVEELGDLLWNIAALCTSLGIDLDSVMRYNLYKLGHRYPSGEFDISRSAERQEIGNDFRATSNLRRALIHSIKCAVEQRGSITMGEENGNANS